MVNNIDCFDFQIPFPTSLLWLVDTFFLFSMNKDYFFPAKQLSASTCLQQSFEIVHINQADLVYESAEPWDHSVIQVGREHREGL